jgi:hypothetical protein
MPAFVDLTELTHFHTPVCNLNLHIWLGWTYSETELEVKP